MHIAFPESKDMRSVPVSTRGGSRNSSSCLWPHSLSLGPKMLLSSYLLSAPFFFLCRTASSIYLPTSKWVLLLSICRTFSPPTVSYVKCSAWNLFISWCKVTQSQVWLFRVRWSSLMQLSPSCVCVCTFYFGVGFGGYGHKAVGGAGSIEYFFYNICWQWIEEDTWPMLK
jgi:hypothetical protein